MHAGFEHSGRNFRPWRANAYVVGSWWIGVAGVGAIIALLAWSSYFSGPPVDVDPVSVTPATKMPTAQ